MFPIVSDSGLTADGPKINLNIYTPARAARPVPMILLVDFGDIWPSAAALESSITFPQGKESPLARRVQSGRQPERRA
jgi:hypothetical protein